MTPDALKQFVDVNATIIMFFVGVAIKYVPGLKKVSNDLIGWINVAGYIVGTFLVGTAHAGVKDAIPDAVSLLVCAGSSAGLAHVLYETLGRTLLERFLKLKKAV